MNVWRHCFQFIVHPLIMILKNSVESDELKCLRSSFDNNNNSFIYPFFYECMETLFPVHSPSSDHDFKKFLYLVFGGFFDQLLFENLRIFKVAAIQITRVKCSDHTSVWLDICSYLYAFVVSGLFC